MPRDVAIVAARRRRADDHEIRRRDVRIAVQGDLGGVAGRDELRGELLLLDSGQGAGILEALGLDDSILQALRSLGRLGVEGAC